MLMASAQARMTQNGAFDLAGTEWFTIRASVMTPMVFCASFVPCARDTMQADPIWPIRKPWLRAPSVRLRNGRVCPTHPRARGAGLRRRQAPQETVRASAGTS